MDRPKCPLYGGVRIVEVGNVGFLAFLGPNQLSVIERCPYYRGVRKERFDCTEKKKCCSRCRPSRRIEGSLP